MKKSQQTSIILLLLLTVMGAAGCKKEETVLDPDNKAYTPSQVSVLKLRSHYDAKLNGWQSRQTEMDGPSELILDIAVVNNSRKRRLNNLTILVTQFDPEGQILREDRLSLAVGDLSPGRSHFLDGRGIACAEGLDGVTVKLESKPRVDDLHAFPEFQ